MDSQSTRCHLLSSEAGQVLWVTRVVKAWRVSTGIHSHQNVSWVSTCSLVAPPPCPWCPGPLQGRNLSHKLVIRTHLKGDKLETGVP